MRGMLIRPDRRPLVVDLREDLDELQEIVGGYLEVISIDEKFKILCDEYGKVKDLPKNRLVTINGKLIGFIRGDFLIVATSYSRLKDLNDDEIAGLREIFWYREAEVWS